MRPVSRGTARICAAAGTVLCGAIFSPLPCSAAETAELPPQAGSPAQLGFDVAPARGATITGRVPLRLGYDPVPRGKDVWIVLRVDGYLIASTQTTPFRCVWDTGTCPEGQHVLRLTRYNPTTGREFLLDARPVIVKHPSTVPRLRIPSEAIETPLGTPYSGATDDPVTIANRYRALCHLPPFTGNLELEAAATSHARYLVGTLGGDRTHDPSPHLESPNGPSYSGKTPADRAVLAGYRGGETWEDLTGYVVAGGLGVARAKAYAVQSLFDAPYHRIPFLRPDVHDFGVGVSEGPYDRDSSPDGSVPLAVRRPLFRPMRGYVVLDFGDGEDEGDGTKAAADGTKPAALTEPILYPVDGQSEVPLAWVADEDPDPLRMHRSEMARDAWGTRAVGYVITYLAPDGPFHVDSAQLTTSAGQAVPCFVNTPENDDAIHGVLLIPKQPLAPATTYTASIRAATGDGTDISRRWSFTTVRDPKRSIQRNVLEPARRSGPPNSGNLAGRPVAGLTDGYYEAGQAGGHSWPGR